MHIAEFSVKNPVMINLAMVAIIIIGLIYAFQLPLELFPSIQLEQVFVTTIYPGASAEDVEQLVSIPIEDEINDIKGIKLVRSISAEGISTVVAELEAGEDVKKIAQDIRSKIAQIEDELPTDAEKPIVQEVEAAFPLINISIAADVPRNVLRQYAIRLRDTLKLVPGVGTIYTSGLQDPVFWVRIDPLKLRQFNLSLEQVARVIRMKNLDLPGGSYEQGEMEYLIRTRGRILSPDDILSIPVRPNPDGSHIYIRDIATVEQGEAKNTTLSRVNGLPAITLFINKQKNVDDVETVKRIRRTLADFKKRLPESIHIFESSDTSYWVRQRFRTMLKSGLVGLIVVLITLGAFLDLRSAAMAALGLPVAFLGAILLMQMTGITFNVLSMFGLILVLGIIVDDAIIVAENIQRYVSQGMPPARAAIRGTKEVTLPILATVLTNIAAFLPLLMATGLIGKFLVVIPKVAIYALGVSLFEALFILPSHCADFLRPPREGKRARNWVYRVRSVYMKALIFILRHRYVTIGSFILVLFITLGVMSRMPFTLFYTRDIPQFAIRIESPTWADIRMTERYVKDVTNLVRRVVPPHMLKNTVALIGMDITRREPEYGDHLANVFVEYEDFEKRKENGLEYMRKVRKAASEIVGPARIDFILTGGPPTGRPVDVRIQGRDFATLKEIAHQTEAFLKTVPGVYAISDDLVWGKPEVKIHVNEARASMYGLDTTTVARAIRAAVDGLTVARTRLGTEEADIVLQYDLPRSDIIALLNSAQIPAPTGGWVPLRELVEYTIAPSMLRIAHYDNERAVRVTAEIDQKVTTAREVNARLERFLERTLRHYHGYTFAFGGEEEETRESIRSIIEAMAIAIVLIYAILASLLRSYTQPLIIMSVMPFGLIGVAIGMLLRGEPFSLPTLIGTVALLGIMVNDALVMMDFINSRRRELHRITAVVYSAKYRFRPVLLTTITTFGGLASLMTKTRGEAAFLAPMAIALGFGLMFATLITLFLIPSLYLILDDTHQLLRRLWRSLVQRKSVPIPAERPVSPTHSRDASTPP